MGKVAMRVFYDGRVQGVGFRATVRWIAEGFEITGWIKNLPDGRVELLVRGESREVRDFLAAIRESELASHIKSALEEPTSIEMGQRGFSITA
ncbi:MAG: acylphosphatase [Chthoniobacterales bacterium]